MLPMKVSSIRPTSDASVLAKLQRAFKDLDHITFLIGQYHPSLDEKYDDDAVFSVVKTALQNATVFVDSKVLGKPAVPVRTMVPIGTEEKLAVEPIHPRPMLEMRQIPSALIHRIMFHITCKALHDQDADALVHSAFKLVVKYSWLRKTLAILAAFTLHYGDYWYWAQSTLPDTQGQQISLLEGSGAMKAKVEKDSKIKHGITMLNELVKDMLEMIGLIVQLTELCAKHPEREVPALNSVFNRLPEWNCQAVICIITLNYMFTQFVNAEEDRWPEWELIQLTADVTALIRELTGYFQHCRQGIDIYESYMQYVKDMENPSSVVDVIKKLHDPHTEALLNGSTKNPVKMESVRGKDVLVVISTWKIAPDDLVHLSNVYTHFEHFPKLAMVDRQSDTFPIVQIEQETTKNFEMIWIPYLQDFIDPQCPFSWPTSLVKRDESIRALQSKMKWLMTEHHSQLHPYAQRYMKEYWYFRGDTIVVALNQSGRVECLNVMPRIRIWGTKAFPYELTINLWGQTPSWIQAVFDPKRENKFPPGKHTFIFGGEDMSRLLDQEMGRFERATALNILRVTDPLTFKQLENLLICRMQYLIERVSLNERQPSDRVFDELSDAYTAYEKGGFGILVKGTDVLLIDVAESALKVLQDYEKWANKDAADLRKVYQPKTRCKSVFLPSMGWWRQDWMRCRETGQDMNYIENYKCCEE